MAIAGKDKKIIKRLIKTQSLAEVTVESGVSEQQIKEYLCRIWGEEKYQRVIFKPPSLDNNHLPGPVSEQKPAGNFSLIGWWRENYRLVIALIVGVWLLYGPFVNNAFLSDDIAGIVNNPDIFNFGWIWQNPTIILNRLIYWFLANVFGTIPWPFRAVNILVHSATVIGVLVLVDKLINKTVATIAAILVAIHPIMIESVIWISGTGYSWYGALLVWSFIFYIKAGKNWKHWLISVGLFLAALQFSEKAAVLPGILILYHLVIDQKRGKWWHLSPYIVLSSLWLLVNLIGVGPRLDYLQSEYNTHGDQASTSLSPVAQIPIAVNNYLSLVVWPDKLTLYHSDFSTSKIVFYLMICLTIIYLLVTGWCLWQGFRGKRNMGLIGFFLSWFIIGLTPTLLPIGVAWIVAERYVYFGAIGIFILMAWGGVKLSQKPQWTEPVWIVIATLICLLMVRTLIRNNDWRDQDHLWLAAERTSPSSQQNHNNLGDLYGRRGDLERAEWHFKKAIEINPHYADAMHNLANTYVQMGRYDEAIELYQEALKNKPSLWQSEEQIKRVKEYLEKSAENDSPE